MQREERIYERRAAAQDGRRLRLEYCRLETPDENTTSFGAAIRCVSDGCEDYAALPDITSKVSTSAPAMRYTLSMANIVNSVESDAGT